MRAMRAVAFNGYSDLKLVELAKPKRTEGRVLVRITAAGVTPLDHTILSGGLPRAKAPLILGNEGAGVVEDPGDSSFPVGARVMFFGAYGVSEDGTYREWITAKPEDLSLIPENLDDARAGGAPVAYLTAQISLQQAGFAPGKSVLAPGIGGSARGFALADARAEEAARLARFVQGPVRGRSFKSFARVPRSNRCDRQIDSCATGASARRERHLERFARLRGEASG